MQLRHHPHLTATARVAAVSLAAGVVLLACGSDGGSDLPPLSAEAEAGRQVMRDNGCSSCHGRNGEGGPGPTWIGLYGSTVELKDGTTVVADDEYLRESIADPGAKLVEGYGFPMPENDLSEAEIEQVTAFIRELADPGEASG